MRILDIRRIDEHNHERVFFIRVEPIDLRTTIADIINALADLSWINGFDGEYIQDAFRARALPTIRDITQKLNASSTDRVSSDAVVNMSYQHFQEMLLLHNSII